jgi:hypothetical protein
MSNIWADTFSAIREPHLSEEKKEKEEKGEKKHKEGPAEENAEAKKENEDNPKRWWDDDGDGIGYEKGEVKGSFKKKVKKEERDFHSKSDKNDKIDVRKGISNKINTKPTVSEATYGGEPKKEEPKDTRMTVTSADRKANTKAWQNYKAGHPSYKAAPHVKEEVKLWIEELVEEGYDIQQFSIEELIDIYESVELEEAEIMKFQKEKGDIEARMDSNKRRRSKTSAYYTPPTKGAHGADYRRRHNIAPTRLRSGSIPEEYELEEADTYGMPAKGDAERQTADPMASAKAKAARAKVAKERADFQVAQQAQRMKVSTTEAVIAFVEGRTPLFEARFDPKKTKLRPASERTKNAMTDAQRKAAKKEAERTAEIHSKGETVLAGLRSSGKRGKVQTTPAAKPAAPEANRKVKGKEDKLAAAADKVLKGLKK